MDFEELYLVSHYLRKKVKFTREQRRDLIEENVRTGKFGILVGIIKGDLLAREDAEMRRAELDEEIIDWL